MPQLAEIMGEVAIEQGRVEEDGGGVRSLELNLDNVAPAKTSLPNTRNDNSDDEGPSSPEETSQTLQPLTKVNNAYGGSNVKSGGLLSRRRTLGAQTLPALPLHLQNVRKSRASFDPLGQFDSDSTSNLNTLLPYQSTPSLASSRTPIRSAAINRADVILDKYDAQARMHLLRGHYYSSEVR